LKKTDYKLYSTYIDFYADIITQSICISNKV